MRGCGNLLVDCFHCLIFLVSPVGEQGLNPHFVCATRRLSHWVKRLISENIMSLASLVAFASGSSFSCQVADCFLLFSSSAKQHGTAPMPPRGLGSPSSLLHS